MDDIDQKLQRYQELAKIPFRSDQEEAEFDQLGKELQRKLDEENQNSSQQQHEQVYEDFAESKQDFEGQEQGQEEPSQDQQREKRHYDLGKYTQNDEKKDKKRKKAHYTEQTQGDYDPFWDSEDYEKTKFASEKAKEYYKHLLRKEKIIRTLMKAEKKEQEVARLWAQYKELQEEKRYMTSKRDKDGFIHIREPVYRQKVMQVEEELKHTTGFFNRLNLKFAKYDLKFTKWFAKFNNGIIKFSRGAAKTSDMVGNLSDQMGELGKVADMGNDSFDIFGEQEKPRKQYTKRRKKGKTSKKRKKRKS